VYSTAKILVLKYEILEVFLYFVYGLKKWRWLFEYNT
jgi:hypothetical protein